MPFPGQHDKLKSIIVEYRLLTTDNVHSHMDTNFWNQYQDITQNHYLYIYLIHSITKKAAGKVNFNLSQYFLDLKKDPNRVPPVPFWSIC